MAVVTRPAVPMAVVTRPAVAAAVITLAVAAVTGRSAAVARRIEVPAARRSGWVEGRLVVRRSRRMEGGSVGVRARVGRTGRSGLVLVSGLPQRDQAGIELGGVRRPRQIDAAADLVDGDPAVRGSQDGLRARCESDPAPILQNQDDRARARRHVVAGEERGAGGGGISGHLQVAAGQDDLTNHLSFTRPAEPRQADEDQAERQDTSCRTHRNTHRFTPKLSECRSLTPLNPKVSTERKN